MYAKKIFKTVKELCSPMASPLFLALTVMHNWIQQIWSGWYYLEVEVISLSSFILYIIKVACQILLLIEFSCLLSVKMCSRKKSYFKIMFLHVISVDIAKLYYLNFLKLNKRKKWIHYAW